jgi:ectoine hydroxylase-related dioxygenase (phytanoyl-CoA dioxygenase family)
VRIFNPGLDYADGNYRSRVFDEFIVIPRVLALNDYFLDPGYQISSFHTITINPNSPAQPIHHDDAFATLPRPRPPLGTAVIAAFDEFTAENGATRVIPGSHLWGPKTSSYSSSSILKDTPDPSLTIPAVCPAGSVVYFISTLWHSGGPNLQSAPRNSLTVQYCQPYMRQVENQYLAVDPRRLDEMDSRIVSMMGYKTFVDFIGYADGLNPRQGARRMIRWLQAPLGDVPTFPKHEVQNSTNVKSKM